MFVPTSGTRRLKSGQYVSKGRENVEEIAKKMVGGNTIFGRESAEAFGSVLSKSQIRALIKNKRPLIRKMIDVNIMAIGAPRTSLVRCGF